MPTYEYRCRDCGDELEVVQSFTDDALTECPSCGGSLRKVFGNIGITFKGSGFYKTDARAGAKGKGAAAKGESSGDSGSSSDSSSSGDGGSSSSGSDAASTTSSDSSTASGDSSAKKAKTPKADAKPKSA